MDRTDHLYSHPLYYEIAFCNPRMRREIEFPLNVCRGNQGGVCAGSILDNGCGTGLHLEKLAKRGLRVTGYDASLEMVEYAARRLSRWGEKAHVFRGDLRDFRTTRKSDMAICMNGSFQHLYSVDDVVRHLDCVARSLKRHGLYLVSLPAPEELITEPPGSIVSRWSRSRGEITVEVDWTYRQERMDWVTQTFSGLARITARETGRSRLLWMPYRYRVFFLEEFKALVALSRCFEVVEVYGDLDVDRIYSRMRKPKAMNVLLRKTVD
jgi:SAM-dependent methyltransferase